MNETAPAGLGRLILIRLLAAGKSPGLSDLSKALKRYFADRLGLSESQWSERLGQRLAELEQRGLLQAKPFRLTENGRAEALTFLKLDALPSGMTWQTLRTRYLLARALEIQPSGKTEWDRLGTADGVRAAVLVRHYDLPTTPVPTISSALHALAWKQLHTAHHVEVPAGKDFTWKHVLRATLMPDLHGEPVERLPAMVAHARNTGTNELRDAIIRQWLDRQEAGRGQPSENAESHPPSDLAEFATRVRELARTSPTGRFGDNKVFLSHLWERFQEQARDNGISREEFNRRLVEANRQNLLTLSRADLVGAMAPQDVQASEIRLSDTTYHFLRTDR